MKGEITGRKFAMMMVAGFGVVIAVNFTMATFAVKGFSGTVVDNSYVASQNYNGWLEKNREQQALGWDAQLGREGDRLVIEAQGVPAGAEVTALISRPLGAPEETALRFTSASPQRFVSDEPVALGRWIVRLEITSGANSWRAQERIE